MLLPVYLADYCLQGKNMQKKC